MTVFLEWLIFRVICTLRSSKRWWRSWKSEAYCAVFPSNLTNFSNDKRRTNHCRTSASTSYRKPETDTNRPTERQPDRHQPKGGQADWETDRHTHTHRPTDRETQKLCYVHFPPVLLLPVWGFLHVACLLSLAESLFSPSLWWASPLSVTSEGILNNGRGSPAFFESLVFSVRTILTLDNQGCTSHFLEWNVLFWLKKKKIPQKRH